MRTLRTRFILSHVLPLLLVIPLMGLVLTYALETHVFLPDLTDEMVREAELIAILAHDRPDIWQSTEQAERFVDLIDIPRTTETLLVDETGSVLAHSQADSQAELDEILDLTGIESALAGDLFREVRVSPVLGYNVAVVWAPVKGADERLLGAVKLMHHLNKASNELARSSFFLIAVLLNGLVLGTGVGLFLALTLSKSLRRVTTAIQQLASGELETLPEQGAEELRLLLRAFNTLTERLRSMESARHHLLANLVHELGRPLGAVQAAIQALREWAVEDEAIRNELLEGMEGQMRRLGGLIENLSQLHGQILGTFELKRQPLTLSTWLPTIVSPWRAAASEKGLKLHITIAADLPAVLADPDRLAQVLGNLLSNAIKYTPTQGTVSLTTGVSEKEIWLCVSDNGVGILPEQQERIWEPFYRSQRGRRFPQGMGLGLAITKDIVQAHGGRICLESRPDVGSRFTVYLPLNSKE